MPGYRPRRGATRTSKQAEFHTKRAAIAAGWPLTGVPPPERLFPVALRKENSRTKAFCLGAIVFLFFPSHCHQTKKSSISGTRLVRPECLLDVLEVPRPILPGSVRGATSPDGRSLGGARRRHRSDPDHRRRLPALTPYGG